MEQNFNELTPEQTEALAILSEECGEVIQSIGKILRHGYKSCHPETGLENVISLEKEIGDVNAAIELLIKNGDISEFNITVFRNTKLRKLPQFLHHLKYDAR